MIPGSCTQNYKLCPKVSDFCKLLKMRKKILLNPQFFVCYCFILYKEKMLTFRDTFKS